MKSRARPPTKSLPCRSLTITSRTRSSPSTPGLPTASRKSRARFETKRVRHFAHQALCPRKLPLHPPFDVVCLQPCPNPFSSRSSLPFPGIQPEDQRLSCSGQQFEDGRTVADRKESTPHLVLGAAGTSHITLLGLPGCVGVSKLALLLATVLCSPSPPWF